MKQLKKKLLTLVLSLVMVLGMAVPVLADDTTTSTSTAATVTVTFMFNDVTFDGDSYTNTFVKNLTTRVKTTTDATLYDTVVTALSQLKFSESDYVFKTVTDYYDTSKTHEALDSITYQNVTYATETHDTTNYYLGAGWTYTGTYGSSGVSYNTYNYLDSNTVAGTPANITLTYGGYKYSKS
jgi:hypothetical protein